MKKLYGTDTHVQSVGVINDLEIDGFSIAVCDEIVLNCLDIDREVLMKWKRQGDDLSSFDLIVALSPAAQRRALELTHLFH